jgi:hypothetical protein
MRSKHMRGGDQHRCAACRRRRRGDQKAGANRARAVPQRLFQLDGGVDQVDRQSGAIGTPLDGRSACSRRVRDQNVSAAPPVGHLTRARRSQAGACHREAPSMNRRQLLSTPRGGLSCARRRARPATTRREPPPGAPRSEAPSPPSAPSAPGAARPHPHRRLRLRKDDGLAEGHARPKVLPRRHPHPPPKRRTPTPPPC